MTTPDRWKEQNSARIHDSAVHVLRIQLDIGEINGKWQMARPRPLHGKLAARPGQPVVREGRRARTPPRR
jgi:hypothetical protein